ncbi:unnamed protein product [Meloidogyne enterolobii]|uniref:Uncharacterized protein n=1 Tax=Meloidogyne enterolobii TaxID=390850 RepID=A0ACB0ZLE3_MELEN
MKYLKLKVCVIVGLRKIEFRLYYFDILQLLSPFLLGFLSLPLGFCFDFCNKFENLLNNFLKIIFYFN